MRSELELAGRLLIFFIITKYVILKNSNSVLIRLSISKKIECQLGYEYFRVIIVTYA
jgi:hypothetical protein